MLSSIMFNQGSCSSADKHHQMCIGLKHEYIMYLNSDEESNDVPKMTISDILKKINGWFPVLDFHQY